MENDGADVGDDEPDVGNEASGVENDGADTGNDDRSWARRQGRRRHRSAAEPVISGTWAGREEIFTFLKILACGNGLELTGPL